MLGLLIVIGAAALSVFIFVNQAKFGKNAIRNLRFAVDPNPPAR